MGCGSSSGAGTVTEGSTNGTAKTGKTRNGTNDHQHHDSEDLPTVVLPESPVQPKPPIAFEIPVEEFDGTRRPSNPPVHLQRLLQPPQPDISLPDIREKLAEAEQRRLSILQARAASAQKRAQKMMKSVHEMDVLEAEHCEHCNLAVDRGEAVVPTPMSYTKLSHQNILRTLEPADTTKHVTNNLTIPPEPGVCEDKNIS